MLASVPRTAIHFVYAGGSEGPREGDGHPLRQRYLLCAAQTMKNGNINGHVLYLTTNGVCPRL